MSDVSNDAEAGQGGSAGESLPQEEKAGLIAALQAERGKRHTLERQMAELKGTVDTLKQNQNQPKEHTKAELQSAVDAGRISQVDADRIWDEQRERKLKSELKQEVASEAQQTRLIQTLNAEIDRYRQVKPNIEVEGSDDRAAVVKAFNYQTQVLGKDPNDLRTEVDALAMAFGPSESLQTAEQNQPETHEEVGSDGGGGKPKGKEPKLPAHAKAHYEKMIGMGIYKGWEDPNLQKEIGDHGGRWR